MPSGAKKRKAAKKKLQKKAINNGSHSNSQGSADPKSYDERKNDNAVVGEENVKGGNVEVIVRSDDVGRNGNNKSSSSSSSSDSGSSSDDDEVVAEKDKSKEPELGKVEAYVGIGGVSEVVNGSFEESIPKEESVKQVVCSTIVSESVAVDNSLTSDVIESGAQQNVGQLIQPLDEKISVDSGVKKVANKVINVKDGCCDGCCKDTPEPESVTARDDEGLLLQSSGVKAVEEECYMGDESKAPETQKYVEEQPLLPSAPLPVRRTSWMDCCGLFEVFSGGPSR